MNVSRIIKKIVFYLEKLTGKIIHQEDIANLFGIDKHTLATQKARNSKVFYFYFLEWCLKNNLDQKMFIEVGHNNKKQRHRGAYEKS